MAEKSAEPRTPKPEQQTATLEQKCQWVRTGLRWTDEILTEVEKGEVEPKHAAKAMCGVFDTTKWYIRLLEEVA